MEKYWWKKCSAIYRFMPELDRTDADTIIRMLPDLKTNGFQAIQITAPYESAGFWPWWGLRPLDYFKINTALGDGMDSFRRIVDSCHQAGIAVIIFVNLGYDDVNSERWKKACRDHLKGIRSEEEQYYMWKSLNGGCSHHNSDFMKQSEGRSFTYNRNRYFLQKGKWSYSFEAEDYYFSCWYEEAYAEPQYNWNSETYRIFAEKVLRFWLSTGIDGVILDAVNFYLNCEWNLLNELLDRLTIEYPGIFFLPEGAGGFGDDLMEWNRKGHFTVLEDQCLESDLHWNGSRILESITDKNPQSLRRQLQYVGCLQHQGITLWSYPSWGEAWTPCYRLMELAVLLGSGHMTEIIPSYFTDFSEKDWHMLWDLLRTANKGMPDEIPEPIQLLQTDHDDICLAWMRKCGEKRQIWAVNFSDCQLIVEIQAPEKLLLTEVAGIGYQIIDLL